MNTAWSDLPNAQYIDWVLKSLDENPKLWHKARRATRDKAWLVARDKALDEALDKARDKARDKAWAEARDAAWAEARDAAWDALTALIAYDDCDQYLAMGYEKLKVYAILSEKPQAVLLQPMAYVRENTNEVPPVSGLRRFVQSLVFWKN